MGDLDRIRWHCRRGMLELDLLLERFVLEHLPHLDAEQAMRFAELLELPDYELLDLMTGHAPVHRSFTHLLGLMRALQTGEPIHV